MAAGERGRVRKEKEGKCVWGGKCGGEVWEKCVCGEKCLFGGRSEEQWDEETGPG